MWHLEWLLRRYNFFIVMFANKLNAECPLLSLFLNRMAKNRHQKNCGSRYRLTFYVPHSIIIRIASFSFVYRFHSPKRLLPLTLKSVSRNLKSGLKTRFPSSLSVFSVNAWHKRNLFMIQFTDAERSYRSDCETDDGISVANDNDYLNGSSSQQLTTKMRNRSPLTMRQSSPFPNEMTNRRMQQYNSAQERLRNGESLWH